MNQFIEICFDNFSWQGFFADIFLTFYWYPRHLPDICKIAWHFQIFLREVVTL